MHTIIHFIGKSDFSSLNRIMFKKEVAANGHFRFVDTCRSNIHWELHQLVLNFPKPPKPKTLYWLPLLAGLLRIFLTHVEILRIQNYICWGTIFGRNYVPHCRLVFDWHKLHTCGPLTQSELYLLMWNFVVCSKLTFAFILRRMTRPLRMEVIRDMKLAMLYF